MPKAPDAPRRRTPLPVAALLFWMRRLGYLWSRGMLSLRTRGPAATLRRIVLQWRGGDRGGARALVLPDPGARGLPVFAHREAPRASVVVPVFNQLATSLACLRALAAFPQRFSFEVIVVDDASTDDTATTLPAVEGLRYLRQPCNAGFIAACNAGAEAARGEFLVFLNNDTAVQPGWLDALLATFDTRADAGLVGARLVYPDGRLQEAGAILYADGTPWSYGRFEPPEHPACTYLRETDYCSGAALAVPRALFARLGSFDPHFAPAYFEDADLAMRIREAGLKVYYQPASRVVHFEGVSAGTDPLRGVKAHQTANATRFAQRWSHRLREAHAPVGTDPRLACDRGTSRRVLVVDAQVPRPDHDSGSLRMFNLLRLLREAGCAVSFLPDNGERADRYGLALEQLGVELWSVPWLGSRPRWFSRNARRFDLAILSRHYVAASHLPLLRQYAPRTRVVFDTVDLHFLREEREAALAGRDRGDAGQTRRSELALVADADASLVVSPHERELLAALLPEARVEVLSNIHAVPGRRGGFAERRGIVFVGGFRHPPNVDAACWMAEVVWPLLHAKLPELELHVVGGDAPARVQALAGIDGVRVHGHVAELDPLMDGCRLAVAPLRYGAGVKGKINLSMAHGQPVVATSCAVEGMHLHDGVDVLVADDAQAFANAVVRLYRDDGLWLRLSDAGIANVERHFSFTAARAALERLLETLCPLPRPPA